MPTSTSGSTTDRSRSKPPARGLSPLAWLGLAIVLTVLTSLTVAGGWVHLVKRQTVASERRMTVAHAATDLADAVERLLAANDLDSLKLQVTEMGQHQKLSLCRVELPDRSVVADLDRTQITVHKLASTWSKQTIPPVPNRTDESQIALQFPIDVVGRGRARLRVEAPIVYSASLLWQTVTWTGAIAAGTVLVVLLILRRFSRHWHVVTLVRQALLGIQRGQEIHPALAIDDMLGPVAEGWNRLITECDGYRKKSIAHRTADALAAHGRVSSELESACDAMWQGLIVVDRQLVAQYVNGAAAVLLQTKREAIVSAKLSDFITDERVLDAVRHAMEGSNIQRRTFEVERSGETGQGVGGMLRISIRPVRRTDPAAVIVVIEDITQLRTAEDASHAFVAQATHELRAPLTNIRLYIENLLDNDEVDPVLRAKSLNVINHESRRLERIVGDMLSVAEIETGSFQIEKDDVRLETLIEELEVDYEAQAKEKGITLAFDLAPKLPVINGDRDKIMMALHNLIANALKYTPNGGKVAVEVSNDDRMVSIVVKDSGIGISPEEQDKIFDKFYRSQDRRVTDITGSGLGLALAREIIRLHGGDITVESNLNKGSTFSLFIPNLAEAA